MSAPISFIDPEESNYRKKCYWWREYLSTRSERSSSELINLYLPIVDPFFNHLKKTIPLTEHDDYLQACRIAVWTAVRTFKPEKGTKFTTWMYHSLKKEPKKQPRDFKQTIHLPSDIFEGRLVYNRLCEKYNREFGIEPTVEELAKYVGFDVLDLTQILARITAVYCVSIEGQTSLADDYDITVEDIALSLELGYGAIEFQDFLESAKLTSVEEAIITHYLDGYTQKDISKFLNINQQQISRLRILLSNKLRTHGLNCEFREQAEPQVREFPIKIFLEFGRTFLKIEDLILEAEI